MVGTIAALVIVAERMHFGERHVRAGNFDVYASRGTLPDTHTSSSLYYGRQELTDYLNGYAVDPNNADRIVFSSDDHYNGDKSVCGTFLYDGKTRMSVLLRNRPYAAGAPFTWSPDSRYLLIDKATVRELLTGHEIDLGDYLSKKDGQRADMEVIQWSPDSRKLASRVGPITEAGHRDDDLIEITVSPLSFRYVATIRDASLVWTDKQIRWSGGELQVATPTDRSIIAKPAEELAWVAASPTAPAPPPIHEGYCSFVEAKK